MTLLAVGTQANAAIVPTVPLSTSANFSVLAGQTVTNTGNSILNLDVGVNPGSAITGFPPGLVNAPGTMQVANAVALQAQSDLTIAYDNAAGRPLDGTLTSLSSATVIGGVYAITAKGPLDLTGTLTLDGQNDPNSVFIFQTDSSLTTASGSSVSLINGAQECNVFWQIGSSATLGTGSVFVGNILALTSISLADSVTVHGRALARNGSVTLINDTFTAPLCDHLETPATTHHDDHHDHYTLSRNHHHGCRGPDDIGAKSARDGPLGQYEPDGSHCKPGAGCSRHRRHQAQEPSGLTDPVPA